MNTFDLPRTALTLRDLEDGQILWKILGDIDPEYFSGSLPESERMSTEDWLPRWQNCMATSNSTLMEYSADLTTVRFIDRKVITYIRDECDKLPQLSRKISPDLRAIAVNGSAEETIQVTSCLYSRYSALHTKNIRQLVKTILLAAMYSPKSNERMIKAIESLGTDVAKSIAAAIGEVENTERRLATDANGGETSFDKDVSSDSEPAWGKPVLERDPGLKEEEEFIRLVQINKHLGTQVSRLTDELERTRAEVGSLEEELAESRLQVDQKALKGLDDEAIEQLKSKSTRDRDYIAELEADLANANATLDNLERQLERLNADATNKQALRDELQLVKAERDEALQKVKANENLRKKIQALQDQAKVNETLRQDLQAAQESLQELETLKERCAALQKANKENVETIANGEQEIFDQKTARKRIEHENKMLTQKLEQAKEFQWRAQETIQDQIEKIRELESAAAVEGNGTGNLDAELTAVEDKEEARVLQNALVWSRMLTSVYRKRANAASSSADSVVLQQQLDASRSRLTKLEEQYLDVYQENLGLQAVVKEAKDDVYGISFGRGGRQLTRVYSSHPFLRQSQKLRDVSYELDTAKGKYIAAMTEVADLKDRLAAAEAERRCSNHLSSTISDSSLTHSDSMDGEDDMARLRAESDDALRERQKYVEELQNELHEQKSLLRHALLSRDALQQEASNVRHSNEYRIVREQLELVRAAITEEADQVTTVTATRLASEIEAGREMVASSVKVNMDIMDDELCKGLSTFDRNPFTLGYIKPSVSAAFPLPPPVAHLHSSRSSTILPSRPLSLPSSPPVPVAASEKRKPFFAWATKKR